MTKYEFSADEDWDTYPTTEYSCPMCEQEVSLSLADFDRHSFSTHTNLSPEDAKSIDKEIEGKLQDSNSFLDFYCPGCHRPVRIYYQAWAGGRYTHGHILKLVVEKAA